MGDDVASLYSAYKLVKASVSNSIGRLAFANAKTKNALGLALRVETAACLGAMAEDPEVRCVVIYGEGGAFSSGIALDELSFLSEGGGDRDPGRRSLAIGSFIRTFQDWISTFESFPKPVIAAVDGPCIGGGIDIITACDIRLCSSRARFSVREARMGLAADIGTLQRLPKVVGCDSWVRDLAYTARDVDPEEALRHGLVQEVCATPEALMERALALAGQIATNSPIAVSATKKSLNYSRGRTVAEGLEHVALLNAALLQTEDLTIAAQAFFTKQKPVFKGLPSSKL